MGYVVSLLIPLAALLLRVTGQQPSPAGRHAATARAPEAPHSPASSKRQAEQRTSARSRPYAADSRTAAAPAPRPARIRDRDAFYRLAELSRHAGLWSFTYDHDALAPYTARHRVDPTIVFAASNVAGLEATLDMLDPPAMLRPYAAARSAPSPGDAARAAAERADLDQHARTEVAR
ncbi:hypothetical protein HNR23_005077 [Nocardiopsis mwathae]|uniref:Uncharacterized protein n=1 Tax=Nocardiopsis mwathae TaxID=1472723 RepID=A0A7W9YMQ3_9ACTN|nr:hypothetical protein [Nocardiopsis mwathae]MBB6175017.1 hypothetical protein [Nocardiopsis mwathae]